MPGDDKKNNVVNQSTSKPVGGGVPLADLLDDGDKAQAVDRDGQGGVALSELLEEDDEVKKKEPTDLTDGGEESPDTESLLPLSEEIDVGFKPSSLSYSPTWSRNDISKQLEKQYQVTEDLKERAKNVAKDIPADIDKVLGGDSYVLLADKERRKKIKELQETGQYTKQEAESALVIQKEKEMATYAQLYKNGAIERIKEIDKVTNEVAQQKLVDKAGMEGVRFLSSEEKNIFDIQTRIEDAKNNGDYAKAQELSSKLQEELKDGSIRLFIDPISGERIDQPETPSQKDYYANVQREMDELQRTDKDRLGEVFMDRYLRYKFIEGKYNENVKPKIETSLGMSSAMAPVYEPLSPDEERIAKLYDESRAKYEAASKLYLGNVDPGTVKKDLGFHLEIFGKGFLSGLVGEERTENLRPNQREDLNDFIELLGEAGMNPSEQQAKKIDETFLEQTASMTGNIAGIVVPLGAASRVQSGAMALTKLDKLIKTLRSGSKVQKLLGFTLDAASEEIKLQTVGMDLGAGTGFKLAAIDPIKVKNPYLQPLVNVMQGSFGATAGMETAKVTEAAFQSLRRDVDFNEELKMRFGDWSEVEGMQDYLQELGATFISNILYSGYQTAKARVNEVSMDKVQDKSKAKELKDIFLEGEVKEVKKEKEVKDAETVGETTKEASPKQGVVKEKTEQVRDDAKTGVEPKEREVTPETKDTQVDMIPPDTLAKANKFYVESKKNLTQPEAAKESFKTIERSDWYKGLPESQRESVRNRYMNDVVERLESKQLPRTEKEKMPSEKPQEKVLVNEMKALKSQIKLEQKAATGGAKAKKQEIQKVRDGIDSFIKANEKEITQLGGIQLRSALRKANQSLTEANARTTIEYMEKSLTNKKFRDEIIQREKTKADIYKQITDKALLTKGAKKQAKQKSSVSPEIIKEFQEIRSIVDAVRGVDYAKEYERIQKKAEKDNREFTEAEQQKLNDLYVQSQVNEKRLSELREEYVTLTNKIHEQQELTPTELTRHRKLEFLDIDNPNKNLTPLKDMIIERKETLVEQYRVEKEQKEKEAQEFALDVMAETTGLSKEKAFERGEHWSVREASKGAKVYKKGKWKAYDQSLFSLVEYIHTISGVMPGRSTLSKKVIKPLEKGEKTKNAEIEKEAAKVDKILETVYQEKDIGKILSQMSKVEEVSLSQVKTKADGTKQIVEENVPMSRGDMISAYMSLKDPSLHKTLFKPVEVFESMVKGNGFTEKTVEKINNTLSEKDKALGDRLMERYQELADKYRVPVSKLLGYDPFTNTAYVPTSRVIQKGKTDIDVDAGTFSGTVKSANTIVRQQNDHQLRFSNPITEMTKYVENMERMVHYGEPYYRMRRLLNNRRVAANLKKSYGTEVYKRLTDYMDVMEGGVKRKKDYVDVLVDNYARGVLGLKLGVMARQTTSSVASLAEVPLLKFPGLYAKAWASLSEYYGKEVGRKIGIKSDGKLMEELASRESIRQRGFDTASGMDVFSFKENVPLTTVGRKVKEYNAKLRTFAGSTIKLGDRTGALVSGYVVYEYTYNNFRKKGFSHMKAKEVALEEFDHHVETTQQHSSEFGLSKERREATGGGRALFAFTSTTAQLFRKERMYANMLAQGVRKKNKNMMAQGAKGLAVYHVLLPQLYTFMLNGFEWDKEDNLMALGLGNVSGLLYLGRAASLATQVASNFDTSVDPVLNNIEKFAANSPRNVEIVTNKEEYDNLTYNKAVRDLAVSVSFMTGVPLDGALQIVDGSGFEDFINGWKSEKQKISNKGVKNSFTDREFERYLNVRLGDSHVYDLKANKYSHNAKDFIKDFSIRKQYANTPHKQVVNDLLDGWNNDEKVSILKRYYKKNGRVAYNQLVRNVLKREVFFNGVGDVIKFNGVVSDKVIEEVNKEINED